MAEGRHRGHRRARGEAREVQLALKQGEVRRRIAVVPIAQPGALELTTFDRLVTEFAAHYHVERTHQGLANDLIVKRGPPANDNY